MKSKIQKRIIDMNYSLKRLYKNDVKRIIVEFYKKDYEMFGYPCDLGIN